MVLLLASNGHAVVSHRAAARLHGLDGFDHPGMAVIEGSSDSAVRDRVNLYLTGGGLNSQPDANIVINRAVPLTGAANAPTGSQVQIVYPFEFIVLNPIVRLVVPSDDTTGKPINMAATTLMRNE